MNPSNIFSRNFLKHRSNVSLTSNPQNSKVVFQIHFDSKAIGITQTKFVGKAFVKTA